MQFTSQIVENAVDALSSFPGIGKRTALRLVMHLMNRPEQEVAHIADALIKLKTELHLCDSCGTVSDQKICTICSDPKRTEDIICVVEDFSDLMAIESTRNNLRQASSYRQGFPLEVFVHFLKHQLFLKFLPISHET